jgi:hypothetical protein
LFIFAGGMPTALRGHVFLPGERQTENDLTTDELTTDDTDHTDKEEQKCLLSVGSVKSVVVYFWGRTLGRMPARRSRCSHRKKTGGRLAARFVSDFAALERSC